MLYVCLEYFVCITVVLDPWDFILLDKQAESKWDFSLRESITRANNEKLLSTYTFQLMVNNAADVLKGNQ